MATQSISDSPILRHQQQFGPGAAGPYHAFGGQNLVGTRCAASVFFLGWSMAVDDAELPRNPNAVPRHLRPLIRRPRRSGALPRLRRLQRLLKRMNIHP
jgi:hypothetical protein